jgi:hypothetical protein
LSGREGWAKIAACEPQFGGSDGHNNAGAQSGPRQVAGGQDHEVKYEAAKTGSSKAEVKSAVKSVGNSRKKVEDKLDKK